MYLCIGKHTTQTTKLLRVPVMHVSKVLRILKQVKANQIFILVINKHAQCKAFKVVPFCKVTMRNSLIWSPTIFNLPGLPHVLLVYEVHRVASVLFIPKCPDFSESNLLLTIYVVMPDPHSALSCSFWVILRTFPLVSCSTFAPPPPCNPCNLLLGLMT